AQLGLERLENPEQHLLLAGTGGQDLGDGVKRPDITMRRTRAVHASKWGNLVPVEQIHAWSPDSSTRGTRLRAGSVGENFWTRSLQPRRGAACRPSRKPGADPGIAPGGCTRSNIPERDLCIDQLRFSTGTYLRRVGPVYTCRGRPIRRSGSRYSSYQWAIHPGIRPIENITVYMLSGMPIARRMIPE